MDTQIASFHATRGRLASRRAARAVVTVAFRSPEGVEHAATAFPADVEALTRLIVQRGNAIITVGRCAPPNGSDGVAYYDAESCGPYWKSDL